MALSGSKNNTGTAASACQSNLLRVCPMARRKRECPKVYADSALPSPNQSHDSMRVRQLPERSNGPAVSEPELFPASDGEGDWHGAVSTNSRPSTKDKIMIANGFRIMTRHRFI